MKKTPKVTLIIKGAMARSGLTALDVAGETGIPYSTIMHQRFPKPGNWRLCELAALKRVVGFKPEEIIEIMEESART